jgi:hypothetical protein
MGMRIAAGCVGGAIFGIVALLLLAPFIRSLKPPSPDPALCRTLWERFANARDLVELERSRYLLEQARCDVTEMMIRSAR